MAHDRVRLPQQEAVLLLERRHEPVGVHRQIGRLPILAERPADIDALVRQSDLADRPHHLLNVCRGFAAPDLDHDFSSRLPCLRRRRPCRGVHALCARAARHESPRKARTAGHDARAPRRLSIQVARFLGQHDRYAVADRVGELGGARDQPLLLGVVFQRTLGQRADQDFQEFRIDAFGVVGCMAGSRYASALANGR